MDTLRLDLRRCDGAPTGIDAERHALHEGNAAIDLSDFEVVDVLGADAVSFLHTKLTAHVPRWRMSGGGYTVATDIDGKVQFDAWGYMLADGVRLVVQPGMADAAIAHLDRYVIMEDARFERRALSCIALRDGSDALQLGQADPESPWALRASNIGGIAVEVAGFDHFAGPSALVFVPTGSLATVLAACESAGLVWVGSQAVAEAQVRDGVSWVGRDVGIGEHIPLEAGLFAAISFDKGCYLGQEVIERLFSRGRASKRLMQLRWSGPPVAPGTVLLAGEREAGVVTASFADGEETHALGYVRRKYLDGQSALTIDGAPVALGEHVGGETAEL
jgi:tRNA-modifying protein YgfZ